MKTLFAAGPTWAILAQEGDPLQWLFGPLLPFILIGVLFYFLLIRPERRKRAELAEMLDSLKKNDRVLTIGGIYGTVVNVSKGTEDVVIKVDESSNTRLRVLRSAISRVITEEEASEKQKAAS